jgi:chemotaxis protein CheD
MSVAAERLVTLVQGEFLISKDPEVVFSTVLGSCVSVCLYDAKAGIGGMNHFLLPGNKDSADQSVKYGVNAMELLINGLLKDGADRVHLKAKVFGASSITKNLRDIGGSNGSFAMNFLKDEGIEVVASSLGGTQARRVKFQPTTGNARQLVVPNQDVEPEVTAPTPAAPKPSVELF